MSSMILYLFICFLPSSVEALTFPPTSGKSFIMGTDEAMESELGLGELAGLTVANEADSLAYDVSRKRQTARFLQDNYLWSHCHLPPQICSKLYLSLWRGSCYDRQRRYRF